jgi:hypothetical protein
VSAMDPDLASLTPLQAVFEAARDFGLTDEEAWRVVDETMFAAGPDTSLGEYLDELAAALAGRILANERRAVADRRRVSAPHAR